MADPIDKKLLHEAIRGVQHWVERHEYKGYEPFDGLTSYLRPLTFGNRIAEVLLQQIGRRSPVNLRPLMGVRPQESTKGRGYMAWGYLHLYAVSGEKDFLDKAEMCLDWLDHHRSRKYEKHSWGNVFDYSSRSGRIPRDEPTIVWTALIAQPYLTAYEQTNNSRWLQIADSICSWIVDLPRQETSTGACLAYDFVQNAFVHNSNMLGAAALARTASHTGNTEYLRVAESAMEYSCSRQRADGSWPYGEKSMYSWIDNFHTGYNLDSLKRYMVYTGDQSWSAELAAGFSYFKERFVEDSGCPRYYHNRREPVDIQGAAQVIDTLAFFSEEDPGSLELALRVADWTIKHMQDRDGFFYYRRYRGITNRAPMIHWGQATMFKALANLLGGLEAKSAQVKGVSESKV